MKKLITLFLCVVVLATVPTVAAPKTGAELLKEYGFVQGNEKGELMVDKQLTRAEACVLVAEMYGLKSSAQQYKPSTSFKDITKDQWYYGYISYAQQKGWVKGYTDGTFKPKDPIAAKEWASMLMNALNYDMNWATVVDDLMTLGVVVVADDAEAISRGEAFEAMWQAVNTARNGEEISLGAELGKLEKPAEKPKAPKLTKGTIVSLKEIVLESNTPLNTTEALKAENYEVTTKGMYDLKVEDVLYDKDAKRLFLYLNRPVLQQADVTLKVRNLKSETGGVLEAQTLTLNMLDNVPPKITGVHILGKRFIKVVFSEPIISGQEQSGNYASDTAPTLPSTSFKVNDGKVSVKGVTLQKGQTEALIETYADLKDTVKIEATETVKDYVNFVVADGKMEVSYSADNTAPTVVGYENASPTGVTLIFSEDIRIVNSSPTAYYHSVSTNVVDGLVTMKDVDGNRLRMAFTKNLLMPGNNGVMVNPNAIQDYAGNKNSTVHITVPLEKDSVKPKVLTQVTPVTETRVRIPFSEPLYNRNGEAQSRAHYRLKNAEGNDVTHLVSTVIYRAEDASVEISFSEALNGTYSLEISGVKDYSENVIDTQSYAFEMRDLTPPDPAKWSARVYNAGKADQMIKVRFDEPMAQEGAHSVLEAEKYIVNGKALDSLEAGLMRIESVDDGASVLIHYPGVNVRGGFNFTSGSTSKVEIGRVADTIGNYIQAFSTTVKLEGKGYMTLVEASQVGRNQIEVVISDVVTAVNLPDFRIEGNGQTYKAIEYGFKTVNNRETVLLLTLSEDLTGDPKAVRVRATGGGTTNQYGETLDPNAPAVVLKDKMAPFVRRASFDGVVGDYVTYTRSTGVLEIQFSETIDPKTVSLLSFGIGNFKISDIRVDDRSVKLVVDAADRDKVSPYDVVTQQVEIRDLAGNGVKNLALQISKVY